jgi:hypothetical protein
MVGGFGNTGFESMCGGGRRKSVNVIVGEEIWEGSAVGGTVQDGGKNGEKVGSDGLRCLKPALRA